MRKETCRRISIAIWTLLLPLIGYGTAPASAQDLKKLATDVAARVHAMKHSRVTVMDFVDLESKPSKLGKFLAQRFQATLAEPEYKLVVVDQDHIAELFDQMEKLSEGLLDPTTSQELGKVAGTEVLILGTVMPSSLSVRLDIKAIDLQTAKLVTGGSATVMRLGLVDQLAKQSSKQEVDASEEAEEEQEPSKRSTVTAKSSRPVRSRTDQGVAFELEGCSLSGDALNCAVSITSNRDFLLTIGFESRAWNQEGEEYNPGDIAIANSRSQSDCTVKQILKNLPTRTVLTFPKFFDATRVERLRVGWAEDNPYCHNNYRWVEFEKIAISEDDSSSSHGGGRRVPSEPRILLIRPLQAVPAGAC